jgi:hypothetical protein
MCQESGQDRGHERSMQPRLQRAGPLGVDRVQAVSRLVQLDAEFEVPLVAPPRAPATQLTCKGLARGPGVGREHGRGFGDIRLTPIIQLCYVCAQAESPGLSLGGVSRCRDHQDSRRPCRRTLPAGRMWPVRMVSARSAHHVPELSRVPARLPRRRGRAPVHGGDARVDLRRLKTGQGMMGAAGMNFKSVFTRDRRPKMVAHFLRARWVEK